MTKIYERLMMGYSSENDQKGVSGKRVAERLSSLAQIGVDPRGGVFRPGFSEEEKAAKAKVSSWMKEASMEVIEDGAGNIIGKLKGQYPGPAFASGSHVDTVPRGGNFDGTVGVVSGLEVAQAYADQGVKPLYDFHVIVFSEEEGSRFGSALIGSAAFTGQLAAEELSGLKDREGQSLTDALATYGTSPEALLNAKTDEKYALYIENHIEQGEELSEAGLSVGVVQGIAGITHLEIEFNGKSDHAGATPMHRRFDPLVAAGYFVSEVSKLPRQCSQTAVATVGRLQVQPNGANVIANQVELTVDIRDIYDESLETLVEMIKEKALESAREYHVQVEVKTAFSIKATPISKDIQALCQDSAEEILGQTMLLPSGAGHDAMNVAKIAPVAMLFVASQDGVSHNPAEWSDLDHIVQGILVQQDIVSKAMNQQLAKENSDEK